MGEPAAIIVKHVDGSVDVHSWGSGGYSLGHELIEHGVERFTAERLDYGWRKETEYGVGNTARAMLGWAESVLVVDETERLILWDLHCLEIESPRLVSHMIEITSPGWQAVWCSGGIDSLWRYLLADPTAQLFEQRYMPEPWTAPDDWFAPFEMPDYGFGAAVLLTARLVDEQSACWLADVDEAEQLPSASAAALEAIAQTMTGTAFEQHALWPHRDEETDYDEWPTSGVHLDFASRRAWGWHCYGLDWSDAVSERWPGWSFIDVGDCWEIQNGLTHGRMVSQPLRDVLHEALGFRSDGTPLSSGSYESYYHYPRMDVLMRELLEQDLALPPAAFLQDDGSICWEPKRLFG